LIETTVVPSNPLDVVAQQVVAMAAPRLTPAARTTSTPRPTAAASSAGGQSTRHVREVELGGQLAVRRADGGRGAGGAERDAEWQRHQREQHHLKHQQPPDAPPTPAPASPDGQLRALLVKDMAGRECL